MSTAVTTQRQSLVTKFADKYSVEPSKLLDTLKSTAFRQKDEVEITNEQMMALLIIADQHNLNPFTKEIYAYPDKGHIVAVVSVDGWARIVNEHPQCDGFEFNYADTCSTPDGGKVECPDWIESVFFRKDRTRPAKIKEHLDEVYRKPFKGNGKNGPYSIDGPWQTHTKRFLRHKAFVQGARLTFGFAGIYDEDEARRIMERDMGVAEEIAPVVQPQSRSARAAAPAIEQADSDGVIEQPMQRQAELVQREERPVQQAQPRTRAARAQQEQFEDPPATPVSDSMLNVLKTKMENNGINESDLKKKFAFDLDGVTTANYNSVVEFLENPV